jgi:putative transcriptional regulator
LQEVKSDYIKFFTNLNTQGEVKQGSILISEPFLGDQNFERTVILVCEHNEEGTLGFVLNRPTEITFDSVINLIREFNEVLYIGGPVQQDSLHFIYRNKEYVEGSVQIADNLFWGGNYEQLLILINENTIVPGDFRFFLGYSGWGEGQLEQEMEKNSWIIGEATTQELFDTNPPDLWRVVLKGMGGKYKMYSNYPTDPRLN